MNCVVNAGKFVIARVFIGHPDIDSRLEKGKLSFSVTYTSSTFWTVNKEGGAEAHYICESTNSASLDYSYRTTRNVFPCIHILLVYRLDFKICMVICFIDTSTTPAYYWSPTTLFMTVNCVVNVGKSVITSGLIGHPVIDSDVRKIEVSEAVTYTSSTFWTVNRNWGVIYHP